MPDLNASLAVVGLITFGTLTSLAAKAVYELDGTTRRGEHVLFQKPWAMTSVMFLGMSLCLPLAYWQQWKAKKLREAGRISEPLLGEDVNKAAANNTHSEAREIMLLAIPTAFDLVATVLMNIGLLSVTASVYQMMRGAEMLFAALFSVVFLHRTLNKYHFGGIACCVAGICCVGAASLLAGQGSATHPISQWQMLGGMALIILSQAVQAAQITFEDFFLTSMDISALKIVGFEGLWGSLAMFLVMLPVVQHLPGAEGTGIHENSLDTWHMITHSRVIMTVLLVDMLALLMYNVSGMCVTGHLGAVFRTVLETTRTLFVWLVDLLLFYTPLGFGKLGESWSRFSLIQAVGFCILVCGTLIYGRGDEVEEKEIVAEMAAEAGQPIEAPATPPAASGAWPVSGAPTRSVSIGRSATGASRPIAFTPSSMKSTMNINAFRGSYVGSMPRSFVGSYQAGHANDV
jgi:drug/metabolite transporter (DMT)-like permease